MTCSFRQSCVRVFSVVFSVVLLAASAQAQQVGPGVTAAFSDQGIAMPAQHSMHGQTTMNYQMTEGCSDCYATGAGVPSNSFSIGRFNVQVERLRLGQPTTQSSYTLPTGRRYLYGNRYFGSLNNRYYGPQYGNF